MTRLLVFLSALALASAAVAAPAPEGRPKVAMLGLSGGAGFDEKSLALVEELVLGALHKTRRFTLIGRSDIASMVGFERQKAMLGCEESSCIADVAGALGVDFLASASVGKLGTTTVMSLKLIDVRTIRVVARTDGSMASEADLPQGTTELVTELVDGIPADVWAKFGAAPKPAAAPKPEVPPAALQPAPEAGSSHVVLWSVVGVVAAGAAGVGLYALLHENEPQTASTHLTWSP